MTVAAFLAGQIRFTDIAQLNEKALERFATIKAPDLESILGLDQQARAYMQDQLKKVS